MNHIDNIVFLAQSNAKHHRPLREDEVKKNIPYFEIYKNDLGKLDLKWSSYKGHDNEPRMNLYDSYFKNGVFPNITEDIDSLVGFYNLELHDGYNYLENGKDYSGVMTFSKTKEDSKPILIPDPYQVCNWGGVLNQLDDTIQFDNKLKKVIFCGTTTGHKNPALNVRLNACKWALDHNELCEFKITKVAQMTELDIMRVFGDDWKDMYLPRHITFNEQMKYRYHMVIDGNVSRFDVWPFKTNSLVLKLASRDMLWYYPLLSSGREFVEVQSLDQLEDICERYNSVPGLARTIISNANTFARDFFKPITHTFYMMNLFQEIAVNKA